MLFSSPIFLFLFLPFTLLGYYLAGKKFRNYFLLFASLIFFAWGGVSFTLVLILSIAANYIIGLKVQKHLDTRKGYWWLFTGVSVNLFLLCIFKYTNFITANINRVLHFASLHPVPQTHIILPIGISFYTFHSLSYLVDIYRRKTNAQQNIFDLSLYIAMFSQLIAGPIIRYSDVWQQLRGRTHTYSKFAYGVERFLIGLGKKVLLANTFGRIADIIFSKNVTELNALDTWLGIACYTLQIYTDFAGYSDMAIGLGRMFGFEFKENFNFPYIARSVKEFWRRWHISLSTFFRDYVYIPLGGNRTSKSRTYINLVLVFLLTGFWHGASWSFVIWGLFHGFFMILERLGLEKILERMWRPISILYTLIIVMFAWVLFRADTLTYALGYWKEMFNFKTTAAQADLFISNMNIEFYLAFAIAVLGIFGFFSHIQAYIEKILASETMAAKAFSYCYHTGSALFYAALLCLCSAYLIAGTYNPFIYYRF